MKINYVYSVLYLPYLDMIYRLQNFRKKKLGLSRNLPKNPTTKENTLRLRKFIRRVGPWFCKKERLEQPALA